MTTLIEAAAKKLMTAIALDRHDVGDWPDDSRKAYEALEQAIAQEQEPLFKVLIDKHPGLADELASQSANTNHVVSQKPAETADKLVRRCETCNHILNATKPYGECFSCEDFSNWEPKP